MTVAEIKETSQIMVSKPTSEQLNSAPIEELKDMLNKIYNENVKLEAAATEARMNAAHQKLQFSLHTIETQEALNRMQVENFMLRKETQLLKQIPQNSIQARYIEKLKEYCRFTENDNILIRRRLHKAKKALEIQETRLACAREEITQLQERIRQNRQHVNEMRSLGGPLHCISMFDTRSGTRNRFCRTPGYNQNRKCSRSPQFDIALRKNEESLNALLLAGSILNQKSNSSPSTPFMACFHPPKTPKYQNDKKRPYSALSNSPGRSENPNSVLLPPVQFNSDVSLDVFFGSKSRNYPRERRRTTRDSTISASDAEEIARHHKETETENIYKKKTQQKVAGEVRSDELEIS